MGLALVAGCTSDSPSTKVPAPSLSASTARGWVPVEQRPQSPRVGLTGHGSPPISTPPEFGSRASWQTTLPPGSLWTTHGDHVLFAAPVSGGWEVHLVDIATGKQEWTPWVVRRMAGALDSPVLRLTAKWAALGQQTQHSFRVSLINRSTGRLAPQTRTVKTSGAPTFTSKRAVVVQVQDWQERAVKGYVLDAHGRLVSTSKQMTVPCGPSSKHCGVTAYPVDQFPDGRVIYSYRQRTGQGGCVDPSEPGSSYADACRSGFAFGSWSSGSADGPKRAVAARVLASGDGALLAQWLSDKGKETVTAVTANGTLTDPAACEFPTAALRVVEGTPGEFVVGSARFVLESGQAVCLAGGRYATAAADGSVYAGVAGQESYPTTPMSGTSGVVVSPGGAVQPLGDQVVTPIAVTSGGAGLFAADEGEGRVLLAGYRAR